MKAKMMKFLVLSVFLFSAVTLYQYYNGDLSELESARASVVDAQFIESQIGITRYQVYGRDNTSTVVLIHSFNGFLESWNSNISALVEAGYRVVAYDLYGRGLSDRPHVKYDLTLFRNQLDLIIEEIGAKSVHLVGSSFGCVIAADYSGHNLEKVDSLVMIGPAGWPTESGRNPVIDIPIVGDLIFHYFGEKILKPKVEDYFVNSSRHHDSVEEWSRFAGYSGFTRSALSTLRHSPVLDYLDGWEKLNTLNKPTLFLWGKQDVSFPFDNAKQLSTLIPHAKVVGVNDAAHWVNIEQSELVNGEIIDFLRVNSRGE